MSSSLSLLFAGCVSGVSVERSEWVSGVGAGCVAHTRLPSPSNHLRKRFQVRWVSLRKIGRCFKIRLMLKKVLSGWSLLLFAAAVGSASCATVTGGEELEDEDGKTGTGTGGTTSSSGTGGYTLGSSGGYTSLGSGGIGSSTGGAVMDDCEAGATESCSIHAPGTPAGLAVCESGAWVTTGCSSCAPDEKVPCSDVDPSLPNGEVTCNSTGTGFVELPSEVCQACEVGTKIDCTDVSNTSPNKVGKATCTETGYDFSTCKLCKVDDTLACDEVPGNSTLLFGEAVCNTARDGWDLTNCTVCNKNGSSTSDGGQIACRDIASSSPAFTGGKADCNTAGDGWDTASCEYCGDNLVNGEAPDEELCDGTSVSATTCGALGFAGPTSGDTVDECTAACVYDTSDCGYCSAGTAAADCLENNAGCTGTSCSNKECGGGFTCNMACGTGPSAVCTGMKCGVDATCNVTSQNGGKTTIDCLSGSDCNVACATNSPAACTVTCRSGAECSNTADNGTNVNYTCQSGSTCDIQCGTNSQTCTVNCASGSQCDVDAARNGGAPTGTANCVSGTCTYALQGSSSMSVNCEGGTCDLDVSTYTTWSGGMTCHDGAICDMTAATGSKLNGGLKECRDGSECHFEIRDWNASANNIVCRSGATCDFTFGIANRSNVFTYTCEAGASCNCTPNSSGDSRNQCACTGSGC